MKKLGKAKRKIICPNCDEEFEYFNSDIKKKSQEDGKPLEEVMFGFPCSECKWFVEVSRRLRNPAFKETA